MQASNPDTCVRNARSLANPSTKKAAIVDLPEELLLQIFESLTQEQIIDAAVICRKISGPAQEVLFRNLRLNCHTLRTLRILLRKTRLVKCVSSITIDVSELLHEVFFSHSENQLMELSDTFLEQLDSTDLDKAVTEADIPEALKKLLLAIKRPDMVSRRAQANVGQFCQ